MKEIQLTNGGRSLVNDEDFEALNQYRWLRLSRRGRSEYAVRFEGRVKDGTFRVVLMHRVILDVADDQLVDHRNSDGLDNRRENIRACTSTQNMQNRRPNHNRTSQFKGLYFEKKKSLWRARIGVNGKQIGLGRYKSETEAAKAYDAAACHYFGEFARLNFA